MTDDDNEEIDSVLRGVAAAPARLPQKVVHAETVQSVAGIAPGVLLVDRYEIVGELGRGGMGRVFAARDRRLARDVAVKILVGEPNDARAFARIEQEARAASRINHPNIATVHDVLATDHGPCIVTELLEGATLRDELAKSGGCSVDEARKMGAQLAAGLTAAHERGVLHRDLKPANLFVTMDRRLKILDFGLAKLDEPHPDAPRTDDGAVLGTSGYMSPEQVRGQRADVRSDLFSAGIVIYEMLMGRRPFEGASRYEIDSRIVDAPPTALRADIPADLAATVLRCLEKDPSRRFQSARELTAALEGTAPSTRGAHRPAQRARIGAAVVVAFVAAVAGVAWFARSRRPALATPSAPPSVAVLPFHDLSPAHDQQYLSDGIAEEILTSLAGVNGLHVAGRTSSFSLRDTTDDAHTIGQKLGVGALLEGSVRRNGEHVRISARLINAADGYQLWAQDFDRGTADLLAVEDELSRDIVAALKVKLVAGDAARASNRGSHDPQAYADYLLARRQSAGSTEEIINARRSIERAIARDPKFAAAWAAYAGILGRLAFTEYAPNHAAEQQLLRQAAGAADQAVALDPDLPEAYLARSGARSGNGPWDLEGARADVEHALALSPNDVAGLWRKSQLLLFFSNHIDEGIAAAERATELDPLDARRWSMLGFGYRRAHRFDEARAAFTRVIEIDPQAGMEDLAELELHDGHPAKALAMLDTIRAPDGWTSTARIFALEALHRDQEARATLAELKSRTHDDALAAIACSYVAIGDLDRAFVYFEKGLARQDLAFAHAMAGPWTEKLRDNPRFVDLRRRMHLLDAN